MSVEERSYASVTELRAVGCAATEGGASRRVRWAFDGVVLVAEGRSRSSLKSIDGGGAIFVVWRFDVPVYDAKKRDLKT